MKAQPLPATAERERYYAGIRLFNARAFFEAHEAWEDAWRPAAAGVKRDFYQGLIQCAVALEHYRRSNPRGVASLYNSYRRKFERVPPVFMGLDVAAFLARMGDVLRPIVEADPLPPRGAVALDLGRTPQITLAYDPFETGEAQR